MEERGTKAAEVGAISELQAEGKLKVGFYYRVRLFTGEVWGIQGATCCNFPPLPKGVILLAVFKCRPG